jgi:hypothetical protein
LAEALTPDPHGGGASSEKVIPRNRRLEMSNQKKPSLRWAIWLWWVLLSAIGGGVGFALGLGAAEAVSQVLGPSIYETVLHGVFGTLVAVLQWFVLRVHVTRASRWVLASAVSWVLVGALAGWLEIKPGLAVVWPAIVGVAVGAFQWLVLRKHVHLAGFWIVGSAVGWVVGWHTATAMDEVVGMIVYSEKAGLAVLFAIFAAVVGAFTGLALIWLLRHPILKKSELRASVA